MPSFKDDSGREYTLRLTYGTACRIEDECDIPILSDPKAITFGIKECVAMAYVMCEDQISNYGIDHNGFGTSFGPEELGSLAEAVSEAVVVFLQGQQPEDAMQIKMAFKSRGMLASQMEEAMETLLDNLHSGSQDSSLLTLMADPSGNSLKCLEEEFLKIASERAESKTNEMEANLLKLLRSLNSSS